MGSTLQFLGGAETVTGSRYLLRSEHTNVLIDCGLFQGYKWLRERNWKPLPFDPNSLDAVILTHAHLDHSGYIPVLYAAGFRGPVYCHHATKELCEILLKDSGHIQEEDARFFERHKIGKHVHPKPLYDMATAVKSCSLLKGVGFHEAFHVGDMKFYLQTAGHILGASSVIAEIAGKRIGFSGDVGRDDDLLMRPADPLPELDLLVLESTYGNRLHSKEDSMEQLAAVVRSTVDSGGVLLIPSFAVGRAQTLQHMLTQLITDQRIPALPIYLDSPMAMDVSDIYCRYQNLHRLSKAQCRQFQEQVTQTRSVDESKALADLHYPHIIIAGSGMATGGRILHHFKRLLANHRTTVLFTGYQAGGTRGAKMVAGVDHIKLHGMMIPCKARIEVLDGLSGHADYRNLHEWLKRSALKQNTKIKLVHGESDALDTFRFYLQSNTRFHVEVAEHMECVKL